MILMMFCVGGDNSDVASVLFLMVLAAPSVLVDETEASGVCGCWHWW